MIKFYARKNINRVGNSQGSALIITILVITVISAIGISVSRLSISQIRQTTQIEDSVTAYYAAESGIEQGLLMWKYNHNVEVPQANMSEDNPEALRVYLDDMSTEEVNINSPSEGNKNRPYYDLRIWYKNDVVEGQSKEIVCSQAAIDAGANECVDQPEGQVVVNTGDAPALEKDGTVEYDVTGSDRIFITPVFADPDYCSSTDACKIEYSPYDSEGNLLSGSKFVYNYDQLPFYTEDLTNNTASFRLRSIGEDLSYYSVNNRTSGEVKISSRYSFIESTGYFGSAKRKLNIVIDRYSKTILGPYDLVIYESE